MMYSVAGIILAGGQSRRMGTNKALLPVPRAGQITFVASLFSRLSQFCPELILVAGSPEQAALYRPLIPASTLLIVDEVPAQGPLMGLYSGLQAMHSTHAFVSAVDLPCLQPPLISFLLSLIPAHEHQLLIPVVASLPQVLLAVYPDSVLPLLSSLLKEGRRDLRALLSRAPVHYLDEADLRPSDPLLRSFLNMNTPDDLSLL